MKLKRTHDCGSLRASDKGTEVVLAGWVETRRDHGGLIFIDLRDRAGITQIAFSEDASQKRINLRRPSGRSMSWRSGAKFSCARRDREQGPADGRH